MPSQWKGIGILYPSIYGAAYLQAFPALAFHFLYRAIAVKRLRIISEIWLIRETYSPHLLQEPLGFFAAFFSTTCPTKLIGYVIFRKKLIQVYSLCVLYFLFSPDEQSMAVLAPFFAGNSSSPVIHNKKEAHEYMQALYWVRSSFVQEIWYLSGRRNIRSASLARFNWSIYHGCYHNHRIRCYRHVLRSHQQFSQDSIDRSIRHPFFLVYSQIACEEPKNT